MKSFGYEVYFSAGLLLLVGKVFFVLSKITQYVEQNYL